MRKLIVLCVVLSAITVTSVSTAAYGYWSHRGLAYKCEGTARGVICDDLKSPYAVSITPTFVSIIKGPKDKAVFFCYRNSLNNCFDG